MKQGPNFVVNFLVALDRLPNLGSDQFPQSCSQAADRHPQCTRCGLQSFGEFVVTECGGFSGQVRGQCFELSLMTQSDVFRFQVVKGPLQNDDGPLPLEQSIGGQIVHAFDVCEHLGLARVESQPTGITAPLCSRPMFPFVDDKPSQRRQQERAKSSSTSVRDIQQSFLQKPREERLRQILCLSGVETQSPQMPMQGWPIRGTKLFQRDP